jgi:hypothetical protein
MTRSKFDRARWLSAAQVFHDEVESQENHCGVTFDLPLRANKAR